MCFCSLNIYIYICNLVFITIVGMEEINLILAVKYREDSTAIEIGYFHGPKCEISDSISALDPKPILACQNGWSWHRNEQTILNAKK